MAVLGRESRSPRRNSITSHVMLEGMLFRTSYSILSLVWPTEYFFSQFKFNFYASCCSTLELKQLFRKSGFANRSVTCISNLFQLRELLGVVL